MPLHPDSSSSNIPSPCMSARPARDSQLLCYERCTCRYTQKPSTSNIPSPCMSARPDEARDSQLLCYEPCTCRYTQDCLHFEHPFTVHVWRRTRHGIPSFCAMSHAHAVTPRLPPLRTSLHRACLGDRHGIPSFCAMSDAHAVTPRLLHFEHPFTVHVWATGRGTGFPASLL